MNLTNDNKDYALFLPSISSVYCRFCSDYYNINNSPRAGKQPEGIEDFESLNFLNEDKGVFYYDHALYSAGHAFLDPELTDKNERMVTKRDRNKTWILGDSGGYQIASGIMNFPWNDIKGQDADKVRHKVLTWLEHTSDYAMLFDFPTRAIANPRATLNSFRDCLEGSLYNFEYFIKNRTGNTKYLNVLQGRDEYEANVWFNEVKDFPFEGWAFGGFTMMDFEILLSAIIKMRDGHYFEENSNGEKRNWLHFLGQSRLITSCAFTSIQRILREQVDPDLTISFDSASAFISVAHGQVYTRDVFEGKRFSYLMEKMYDSKELVGSTLPFPWRSSIGDKLTLGDICVKPEGWTNKAGKESKTSWDSYSYILLMCHNVERHIKAIQQANQLADLSEYGKTFVPKKLVEFQSIVKEIFESESPFELITKYRKSLNNLTGRKTGLGNTMDIQSNLGDLFDDLNKQTSDEIDYENQDDTELVEIEKDA